MHIAVTQKRAKEFEKAIINKRELDEKALTKNAARLAFDAFREYLVGKRVLLLVGPGGNGSDALEMAYLLKREKIEFRILRVLKEKSIERDKRYRRLKRYFVDEYVEADVVIDGIFGISYHTPIDSEVEGIIDRANKENVLRLSLDVPSAFLFSSSHTVTFGFYKVDIFHPLKRRLSGEILLRNPGFPDEDLKISKDGIYVLEESDYKVNALEGDAYKNTRGHLLLVMGGSSDYRGAPVLAALSAFKASAGLVTLCSEETVLADAAVFPSIIRVSSVKDYSKYSSIVIGPGWSGDHREDFESAVSSHLPLVVDSGAFVYMKEGVDLSHRAILTPHLGEFRYLLNAYSIKDDISSTDGLINALRTLAVKSGSIVILKASTIWITDGESIYIYDGFNEKMGVAGSGDVLCGIIGALINRTDTLLSASISSVILHQRSGKRAERANNGFFTSEELIREISL